MMFEDAIKRLTHGPKTNCHRNLSSARMFEVAKITSIKGILP